MKNPLLTVIIPMYGVEKFIAKCLDSVIKQTYDNLEIICVNDGTPDKSAEIAREYSKKDERIRVIDNEKNLGLFRARVEGLKVANGEYIAFVDADDYISVDWFRLLYKRIKEEDADMVIGNTVNVDETGYKFYYNNYRNFTTSHDTISGDELLSTFYEQEGSNFVWHTVWNKLYKRELVEKCMPYFLEIDFLMIMGEDIAFSSVFYTHAKKLAFADVDCYFYYRHSEASTSITLPKEKIIRNIYDIGKVFQYVESSLREYSEELYEKHKAGIEAFKSRYQRTWRGNIWSAKLENDRLALDAMESAFGVREGELPYPHDFYFYELTSPWSDRFEGLKYDILEKKYSVISFDIFDTLILRPFYTPTDLHYMVGKRASAIVPFLTEQTFPKIRASAEYQARVDSKEQDVTMNEIYAALSSICSISLEDAYLIRDIEEELEIKYCTARRSAKELFDIAMLSGKRVIITSDMYLDKSTVEKILAKNGYTGYEKLYISSETLKLKATGDIFKLIVSDLGVSADRILHIGDNWNSDVVSAQNCGYSTYFLPKATETFENGISDIYTGNQNYVNMTKTTTQVDTTASKDQLPVRCALALAADKYFDNPFKPFQWNSEYNADAYYVGYTALGIHLLGMAEWIYKISKQEGYEKIVFLARDGKMIKEAFDALASSRNYNIKTEYFYANRKSLMPYGIKEANDFYSISKYMDVNAHTPRGILNIFTTALKPLCEEDEKQYKRAGVKLDKNIENDTEYYAFINALISISYDKELLERNFDTASRAFKNVFTEKTAAFDLGYSGRLQTIICDLAGASIDVFYLHSNGYSTDITVKDKFKIHSFYGYTPTISGIVREFFMSDPVPSCKGYSFEENRVIPIIEEKGKTLTYEATYAIKEMQKAAVDFCKEYVRVFGNDFENFSARASDYSAAFENYLTHAKEFDRYMFSGALVEDEVYGGYDARSIFDIWTWHQSQLQTVDSGAPAKITVHGFLEVMGGSKIKKALMYLMYDRATFKEKVSFKLRKHKILLGIFKVLYAIPRGIYRIFKPKRKNK